MLHQKNKDIDAILSLLRASKQKKMDTLKKKKMSGAHANKKTNQKGGKKNFKKR